MVSVRFRGVPLYKHTNVKPVVTIAVSMNLQATLHGWRLLFKKGLLLHLQLILYATIWGGAGLLVSIGGNIVDFKHSCFSFSWSMKALESLSLPHSSTVHSTPISHTGCISTKPHHKFYVAWCCSVTCQVAVTSLTHVCWQNEKYSFLVWQFTITLEWRPILCPYTSNME